MRGPDGGADATEQPLPSTSQRGNGGPCASAGELSAAASVGGHRGPGGWSSRCLRRVEAARLTVHLHPAKLSDVRAGVREHISGMLMRYDDEHEGIVMSYSDEKVLSTQGIIHSYIPYVRVLACATLTLFRPQPGAWIVGTVNQVGADHLGLLVLGVFNAALAAADMPAFACDSHATAWVHRKHGSHRIALGDDVRFRVTRLDVSGAVLAIVGCLDGTGAGLVTAPKVAAALAEEDEAAALAAAAAAARANGAGAGPSSGRQAAKPGGGLENGRGALPGASGRVHAPVPTHRADSAQRSPGAEEEEPEAEAARKKKEKKKERRRREEKEAAATAAAAAAAAQAAQRGTGTASRAAPAASPSPSGDSDDEAERLRRKAERKARKRRERAEAEAAAVKAVEAEVSAGRSSDSHKKKKRRKVGEE